MNMCSCHCSLCVIICRSKLLEKHLNFVLGRKIVFKNRYHLVRQIRIYCIQSFLQCKYCFLLSLILSSKYRISQPFFFLSSNGLNFIPCLVDFGNGLFKSAVTNVVSDVQICFCQRIFQLDLPFLINYESKMLNKKYDSQFAAIQAKY